MKNHFLLFFIVFGLQAFQPPQKPAATQKKESAYKKAPENKFITAAHSVFTNPNTLQQYINEGMVLRPEEFYQLLQVKTGEHAGTNIEFWFLYGTYFLMYGTVAPFPPYNPDTLKDLASSVISKDTNAQRREQAIKNPVSRRIAISSNLDLLKKEIQELFNKAKTAAQGAESPQKILIRDQMREKAISELTRLWEAVLSSQPSGFSATVLGYIAQILVQEQALIPNAKTILDTYINAWVRKRCPELLQIINYMKSKGAIVPIRSEVKQRMADVSGGDVDRPLYFPTSRQHYNDFVSMLDVNEENCTTMIKTFLIKRLGPQAIALLQLG